MPTPPADIFPPQICGAEREIEQALQTSKRQPIYLPTSKHDFKKLKSCACIALHMHQPLIPAGGPALSSARIISNLQRMLESEESGEQYNANIYIECYRRMAGIITSCVNQGQHPRIMLDYSGTLLYGFQQLGLANIIDDLKQVTCDPRYWPAVEWLGSSWGHAVAPSTPVQDYRLHVKGWQQHFASIFGLEALGRVRGFSPAEMALPNHPELAYEFVKTLKDCGYQWLLVQEHTVEDPLTGRGPAYRHIPHRLVCRNAQGDSVSILALIKTQGSDTKLVGQMQPWYEACGLSRFQVGTSSAPSIVTQIADGENGGVMMNEFPGKYTEVVNLSAGKETPLINGTEYLELLFASGIKEEDLPIIQPIHQKLLWDRLEPGAGLERLNQIIEAIKKETPGFHMEGGSWTGNISWVKGYEDVLGPMQRVSALFNARLGNSQDNFSNQKFSEALFYLFCSQTSCFRYWGSGIWTDYGKEFCRRAEELLR